MKLINSNRFPLPGTEGRFVHLATVHRGVREFMAFTDVITGKCYIEEITGGHLSYIDDDPLLVALTKFLQASGKLISYERDEELLEKRKREGSDEEESLIWTGPK